MADLSGTFIPDPTDDTRDGGLVKGHDACKELIERLREQADPANVEGMARFGISSTGTLGVTMRDVRALGREALREHRRDGVWRHDLATCLWQSEIHEARILATIAEDSESVTQDQALAWAQEVDSWDVCDQLCMNLLRHTPFAWDLAHEWTRRDEEFVKRAGFVLIATLALALELAGSDVHSMRWVGRDAARELHDRG